MKKSVYVVKVNENVIIDAFEDKNKANDRASEIAWNMQKNSKKSRMVNKSFYTVGDEYVYVFKLDIQ